MTKGQNEILNLLKNDFSVKIAWNTMLARASLVRFSQGSRHPEKIKNISWRMYISLNKFIEKDSYAGHTDYYKLKAGILKE